MVPIRASEIHCSPDAGGQTTKEVGSCCALTAALRCFLSFLSHVTQIQSDFSSQQWGQPRAQQQRDVSPSLSDAYVALLCCFLARGIWQKIKALLELAVLECEMHACSLAVVQCCTVLYSAVCMGASSTAGIALLRGVSTQDCEKISLRGVALVSLSHIRAAVGLCSLHGVHEVIPEDRQHGVVRPEVISAGSTDVQLLWGALMAECWCPSIQTSRMPEFTKSHTVVRAVVCAQDAHLCYLFQTGL